MLMRFSVIQKNEKTTMHMAQLSQVRGDLILGQQELGLAGLEGQASVRTFLLRIYLGALPVLGDLQNQEREGLGQMKF